MRELEGPLGWSVENHGHLSPGQVLGVRMAMTGCRAVGIDDPKNTRDLIVYAEIDRCATDAIRSVTGCKLGKRTLRFLDYGKMAALFTMCGKTRQSGYWPVTIPGRRPRSTLRPN